MEAAAASLMDRRVLVIDKAFQLVGVVNLRRAWKKLFSGRAEVIVYSKDDAVVGWNRDQRLPSVIQLVSIVPRWKQRVRFCRRSVFARDAFTCSYCGAQGMTEDLTLDHVIPRAQGGTTVWENVVCACVGCNQRKAHRTPDQAGMKLRRRPFKPSHVMQVEIKEGLGQIPAEWKDYWTETLEK